MSTQTQQAESILGYMKRHLEVDGDFMKEYRRLDAGERESLKAYARQEVAVLGLPALTEG